jgi:hypothetical protein
MQLNVRECEVGLSYLREILQAHTLKSMAKDRYGLLC